MNYSLKMDIDGKEAVVIGLHVAPNASTLFINISLYTIRFTQLYTTHKTLGIEFSNEISRLQDFNFKHRELIATHSDRKYRDKLFTDMKTPIEKLFKQISSTYGLKLEITNE